MNENMILEEKTDLLEASKESAVKLSEAAGALAKTIEAIAEYVPTVWVDNSEPDIDAEKLNHIEEGIKSATEAVNSAIGSIAQLNSDLTGVVDGLSPSLIASGLNFGLNFGYFDGGYYVFGGFVFLNIELSVKNNLENAFTDVLSGFPPIAEKTVAITVNSFQPGATFLPRAQARIIAQTKEIPAVLYIYGTLTKGQNISLTGFYRIAT